MVRSGIIINNIGSPENCDPQSVQKYLSEFLYDPYVIQIPNPMRFLLVKWLIAPFRAKASASKYKKIWGAEKSPLIEISESLAEKIQHSMGQEVRVVLGMRYSSPSIKDAVKELKEFGAEKIFFLPMYPQYATASTESSGQKFRDELSASHFTGEAWELVPFYDETYFLELLAAKLKKFVESEAHFIFSYHSLPLAQLQKLDAKCEGNSACCGRPEALQTCYRAQCLYTTKRVAQILGLTEDRYTNTFQSRLGLNKWIGPNLPLVLEDLSKKHKHIVLSAPSFVTDCLETLEEIDMENRKITEAAGSMFTYVPCLNSDDDWAQWVARSVSGATHNMSKYFRRVL